MDPARISELLRPFLCEGELSAAQVHALQAYLGLLMRWNARMNLTAVRDEEHIVTRHIGESLFAACQALPNPKASVTVIDVGSGAGFPGLPMKVYAPGIELTLIEAQHKKAAFLKEAVRTMRLDGVRVISSRAETVKRHADLVTMRAVEQFDTILPVAASLVSSGGTRGSGDLGRIALLIGEAQISRAAELVPDFTWRSPARIPLSASRVVVVGERRPSLLQKE